MERKVLDRINEAYKGKMGEDFEKKTRHRINWIVNHTRGLKVLDIGCSQGIVDIILGREGKMVDAIDIVEESIEYAKEDLRTEHESVQNNVRFRTANFMTDEELRDDYETILLTEVLEHISDPKLFLEKIDRHLIAGGRLVVTVPFGINDYFDHKRTYYFLELAEHLAAHFHVQDFHYLGKWVGVICEKNARLSGNVNKLMTRENIAELEKAFYIIERELLTRVESFQAQMTAKNNYVKALETQKQQYLAEIQNLKKEAANTALELSQGAQRLELKEQEISFLQQQIEQQKASVQKLEDEHRSLQSMLQTVQEELQKTSRTLKETHEQELREKQQELASMKHKLKQQQELVQSLEEGYSSFKKVMETAQAAEAQAKHVLEKRYEQELAALQEELKQEKQHRQSVQEEQTARAAELTHIQEQLKQEKLRAEVLEREYTEQGNELTALREQYKQLLQEQEAAVSLQSKLAALREEQETQIKTLREEEERKLLQKEEELTKAREQIQKQEQHIKELQEEQTSLEAAIRQLYHEIDQTREWAQKKLEGTLANEEQALQLSLQRLESEQRLAKEKNAFVQQLAALQQETDALKQQLQQEQNKLLASEKERASLQQKLQAASKEAKEQQEALYGEMDELLKKEEKALQAGLEALNKNEKLASQLQALNRKYDALKGSKLGNLTLKYWDTRKRLSKK